MDKLYPPYIESKIPAFTGTYLKVPFQLNRAVGRNEFSEMAIIVKTVQTNTIKINGGITTVIEYDIPSKTWYANFDLSTLGFTPNIGQYYKIQIAFSNPDGEYHNIGYYSNVGVIKCTTEPTLLIKNLNAGNNINYHTYEYTGLYSQNDADKDRTEKVYSYRFDLYDEQHNLIETSGDLIHNASLDTERYESTDSWIVTKALVPSQWYSLQYTVKTLNDLTVSTQEYKIIQMETVDMTLPATLSAEMIHDEGYVDVRLVNDKDNTRHVRGAFVLSRSSSEDNFDTWHEIYRFELTGELPNKQLWKDFTVQQGFEYKYAIQAYNTNDFYSNRLLANNGETLYADFEDMFLFDGKRQLKIRFNPKVTSFKSTHLETKVDTLGGKYPFIFRNGRIEYKEFPISGLLSYLSDPNELFLESINPIENTMSRSKTAGSDTVANAGMSLGGDMIRRERQFKMEALAWLTNGEPKLFRSPAEGNFIIRLLNVSMTPNDTLGRMLHTFTATAYEIAEYNFVNLNNYGFIYAPQIEYREMKIGSKKLIDIFGGIQPVSGAVWQLPGSTYFLTFSNQFQDSLICTIEFLNKGPLNIDICDYTGHRNISINDNDPVVQITYQSGIIASDAIVTYGYYDTDVTNNFSYIVNMTMEDKIEQYVGTGLGINIIDLIEDIRLQTGRFYYIKLTGRYRIDIYESNGNYFYDDGYLNPVEIWDDAAVYRIINSNNNKWLYGGPDQVKYTTPNYTARMNADTYVDLSRDYESVPNTNGHYNAITNIDDVAYLEIGDGVIADVVYQLKTILYEVELNPGIVYSFKAQWQSAKKEYEEALLSDSVSEEELAQLKDTMDKSYATYIRFLTEAVEEAKGDLIYVL